MSRQSRVNECRYLLTLDYSTTGIEVDAVRVPAWIADHQLMLIINRDRCSFRRSCTALLRTSMRLLVGPGWVSSLTVARFAQMRLAPDASWHSALRNDGNTCLFSFRVGPAMHSIVELHHLKTDGLHHCEFRQLSNKARITNRGRGGKQVDVRLLFNSSLHFRVVVLVIESPTSRNLEASHPFA